MMSSETIYLTTKTVDDIEIGDLIQLSRALGLYAHWAVYVGQGEVIHLSPPPSVFGAIIKVCRVMTPLPIVLPIGIGAYIARGIETLFATAKVRRDRLIVVAEDSAIVVNNEYDDEMRPFSGARTVQRAESKLGTNCYNLLTWNCEHFATWCRYGTAKSKQVGNVFESLSKNAYLVTLPGRDTIPRGSLSGNILAA